MMIFYRLFFIIFIVGASDVHASASAVAALELGEMSFEDYATKRGEQPRRVVFGCGKSHREKTCGGFLHDHDDYYTVDSDAAASQPNFWGISKPHKQGSVFDYKTWGGIPAAGLEGIVMEHVPIFMMISPMEARQFLKTDVTGKQEREQAKKLAYYVRFNI